MKHFDTSYHAASGCSRLTILMSFAGNFIMSSSAYDSSSLQIKLVTTCFGPHLVTRFIWSEKLFLSSER